MIAQLRARAVPIIAVVLVAVGVWLYGDASSRRDAQAAGTEAVQAARDSLAAMLSYRADTVEQELDAARKRLTGRFLDDYTQLTKTVVIPDAKQRGITAAAKVSAAAVVSATPDSAVVLAYIDQTTTVGKESATTTASTPRVNLDKVDGQWLISGFQPI